jgi:UDP-glucose 4,6-dehydratase
MRKMSARCVTVPEQIRAKLAYIDDYTPGNILVTGGAGFIASHVATRLIENYPQYMVR